MASFEKPGPWRWEVQAVVKDGRVTTDFQRWLNSVWANSGFLNTNVNNNTNAIAALTGTGFVPLVDGAEPPSLISDATGQLIFVAGSF